MAGIHWSDEAAAATSLAVDRGSITIEQSAIKQYAGVIFGFSGGLVFLVAGLAFGGEALWALAGFWFFGIVMILGGVVSLRRGSDLRLIEVGPDGMWLPDMGRLGWSDIREVRLEVLRGVGGGDRIVPYRRLGVEPMDPEVRPSGAMRLSWGLFDGYSRFLKAMAPGVRFGGEDRAPFGFGEPEASRAQLDAVIAVVGRYVEIADADAERARARAPRWAAQSEARMVARPVNLGAIDARLAPGAAPVAAPAVASVGPTSFVPVASVRPPEATFRTPPLSPGMIWRWVLAVVPLVTFGLFALSAAEFRAVVVIMLSVAVIIVGPQVVRFGPRALETLRRSWLPAEERTVLRVGPDGIWLPGLGTLAWDRVRAIRARVAGAMPVGVTGQIPRWGLFVEPEPGAAPAGEWAVYADQLDTSFDDVVDLVRYYHAVDDS